MSAASSANPDEHTACFGQHLNDITRCRPLPPGDLFLSRPSADPYLQWNQCRIPTDPANLDSSELKQEPDWPRNPQTECSYALSAGWGEELQDPITMQSPSQNQQHTPKTGQRIWQPMVA